MSYSAKDFEDFIGDKTTGGVNSTPLAGMFYNPSSDKAKAQSGIDNATGAYNNLTPPSFSGVNYEGPAKAPDAVASQEKPSAMAGAAPDAQAREAQTAQIAALQQIQARGGRTAASDANLAAIQQSENQNARAQRDAALQGAARRGMSGSGASLLASLDAGQSAVTRESQQDLGVAGQEANLAMSAGNSAAQLGSNLEGQDFAEQASRAQAQDAVDRFNAGQGTHVSEFNANKNQGVNNATATAHNATQTMNNYEMPQTTFQDQAAKAGGVASTNLAGTKYHEGLQKIGAQQQGNLWGSAAKLGSSAMGAGGLGSLFGGGAGGASATGLAGAGGVADDWGGDAGIATAGGDFGTAAGDAAPIAGDAAESAAYAASTGGRVPGTPAVPGNSTLNDFIPLHTSPGEVVVPRTLAMGGSKREIGDFVQHAPTIRQPGQNKEAMLSALKSLRQRRAV